MQTLLSQVGNTLDDVAIGDKADHRQ
jgi:hypothetical protein